MCSSAVYLHAKVQQLLQRPVRSDGKNPGHRLSLWSSRLQRQSALAIASSNSVQEKINFLPGPAEHTAKGAHDPAHKNDNHEHKCERYHRSHIRMPCGKPCKEHSERVLSHAQCDIGKRLRIGSHGCANGGLA